MVGDKRQPDIRADAVLVVARAVNEAEAPERGLLSVHVAVLRVPVQAAVDLVGTGAAMLFICPPVVWPYSGGNWTVYCTNSVVASFGMYTRGPVVHAIVVVQAFNLEVVADGALAADNGSAARSDAAVGRHAGSKERQARTLRRSRRFCWAAFGLGRY